MDAAGFGLPVLEDSTHLMAYEFARARRYERPISIMALATASVPSAEAITLRFADMLAVDRGREVALVLMPETDAQGLAGAMRRIRAALPVGTPIGAASFPEDALTLEDLTDAAINRATAPLGAAEAA
jgi:hypothetical protein